MCKVIKNARVSYISLDRDNMMFRSSDQVKKDTDLENHFFDSLAKENTSLISRDKFNAMKTIKSCMKEIEKYNNYIANLIESDEDYKNEIKECIANLNNVEIIMNNAMKLYSS